MTYDIIIIGAGCAGLTAAVYARRAGKTVLLVEAETVGGQIGSSPRVENFPSIISISGAEFSDNLFTQATQLGAEFELERVTEVIPGDTVRVITEYGEHTCKKLIIATGARHKKLGISDEDRFEGRGISYCAVCDGAFYKGKTVAVVGGGNAALQSAQYLAAICQKVYLIHRRSEFRGEKQKADELTAYPNIELVMNSEITSLGGEKFLTSLTVTDVNTGSAREIPVDGLFVAVGQIPQNSVFEGVVELDGQGYIVAGEDCKTNVKGIFAAGDCRTKAVRQLTTAAADGAVSAIM